MNQAPDVVIAPRLFCEAAFESPRQLQAFGCDVVLYTTPWSENTGPNEDAAAILPYDGRSGLFTVADGVGGQQAGEEASRTALETLRASIEQARRTGSALREAVIDSIDRANARLLKRPDGAATTLVVLEVAGRSVRPYHVGDAEALVCGQRGRLKHRTVAHSPVGYGVESGLLDESEALKHAERHLVSNVLGDAHMRIEIGPSLTLATHDTAVLGSDGLFDNVAEDELVEIIRRGPLPHAAKNLVALATARMAGPDTDTPSKPDDLTFILMRRQPDPR